MKLLLNIVRGIMIGIANVIPGLSGGTMAVSFGIYDQMIASITGLLKDWKKSLAFLWPLILGIAIGVIGFARLIEFLLSDYPLPTGMAFIGLIFGGLPILLVSFREERAKQGKTGITAAHVIVFALFLALIVAMTFAKGNDSEDAVIAVGVGNAVIVFFLGVIASATMVIPGVSGSMMLMILGYYYGILNLVNSFMDALRAFDFAQMIRLCALLVPFGLGVLLGIGGIAKLIDYLFRKQGALTYSAVLGLVAASPFAILYHASLSAADATLPAIFVGVAAMAVCGVFTYVMGKKKA